MTNDTIPTLRALHPTVQCALSDALHDTRVGIAQAAANEFLVGLSVLYRRLDRALSRCLNTLTEYEARRDKEGWDKPASGELTAPLDDFLETVYIAAEIYDFYKKRFPRLFGSNKQAVQKFASVIGNCRQEADIICNKCKHEFGYLQLVDVSYERGTRAAGFLLYRMMFNDAEFEKPLHKRNEAFSFNWALRRLIGNLAIADHAAAELARSARCEAGDVLYSRNFVLPLYEVVRRIVQRPVVGMPDEAKRPRPYFDPPYIRAQEDSEVTIPQGRGLLHVYADILCDASTFELPYIGERFQISSNIRYVKLPPVSMRIRAPVYIQISDD